MDLDRVAVDHRGTADDQVGSANSSCREEHAEDDQPGGGGEPPVVALTANRHRHAARCRCDLGMGCPELGSVRLSEIGAVRGALGLPVERDLFFEAATPLSRYAADALKLGMISA